MSEFSVTVIKSWPEKLNVVDRVAFSTFTNGEKLGDENVIMDVRACAMLHVFNPDAKNPEYDVIAFLTECGIYYTGSETVQKQAFNIIDTVVEEEPETKIFTLRTNTRESIKNKGRRYLTIMLLDTMTAAETH